MYLKKRASRSRDVYRRWRLRHKLWTLARLLRSDSAPSPRLLDGLVGSWANPWSVDCAFLASMLHWFGQTSGPVLECGSGLSTLVLATAVSTTERHLLSLEDDAAWAERVERALPRSLRARLDCRVAPLVSYGEFDWYAVGGSAPARGDRFRRV